LGRRSGSATEIDAESLKKGPTSAEKSQNTAAKAASTRAFYQLRLNRNMGPVAATGKRVFKPVDALNPATQQQLAQSASNRYTARLLTEIDRFPRRAAGRTLPIAQARRMKQTPFEGTRP